ncbi:hypothetical protein A7981_07935 [Methylovorus sp. MM2]|uniref:phosphoethanolamine transferase CptA n=1 Tax=Methylovorus sp. MM2 TaxID=1848038 RepID=UPI0007E1617D|nr:phosphoethanolamine transferase CptA [Methylovorus sp. MM2]OAM51423.1 hypothetical protein A7981_07935 [Methylovorus sp. MM2]
MTSSNQTASQPKFFWSALGWQYLFFWYFSGVTQLIIQLTGASGFVGFRQASVMSLLWLIPTLLFPHRTRVISAVIGIALWAFSLASLGYLFIYHQEFSQSVMFIMFESNMAEAGEYLSNYFSWYLILGILIYSAVAYLLWKRIRPVYLPLNRSIAVSVTILTILFIYPVFSQKISKNLSFEQAIEKVQDRMEPAVPWQIVVGYLNYRRQLSNMEVLLEKNAKIPPLKNLTNAMADTPATLILVIGESTNRQRMSLYGYGRKTTPHLDSMRDDLAVFTDVVSPRPYTIEVLQQVLTFGDQEHPDLYLTQPSLLNMMKQAGYKTYWITNQQTMTKRNTMLTTFSQQTDEQYYLNNNRNQDAKQYDESVLAPLEKVLQQPAPHKFIVVHLLGTHMNYKYRYPDTYKKFEDRNGVPEWVKDGDQLAFYNSYDNAVLYNDFVISSIIKQLAADAPNSLLLYLSDHGEEVYDTLGLNFQGRNEASPLATMYTIPFIIWTSKAWKEKHPFNDPAILNRPYGSADLIYTWADLVGLNFEEFDASKSIINSKFTEHPRLIGDPYAKKPLVDFKSLAMPSNNK